MVQQPTPVLPPPPAQPAFTPRPTAPQPAVQQERPAPAPPATPAPARRPPAYWWLSILAVSGFGIFGLVALIFSVQVVRRFDQGDLTGARRASRSVLGWGITGLALGVIWLIYSLAGYWQEES